MILKFKNLFFDKKHKFYFSQTASWLVSLAILASASVGFSTSIYFTEQAAIQQQADSQFDPVQARLSRIEQAGTTGVSAVMTDPSNNDDDTDLSAFLGRDLADLENIIIEDNTKAISFRGDLPKTGIRVVSTEVSLTKNNQTTKANAYDYVNLKYVQYNKKTKQINDVKFAPPPGLFADNTWPTLETSNNQLSKFFPTRAIRQAVAGLLGKTLNDNFSKDEWFNAFDQVNLTLDLSNQALNSIAEIFNPNLRWGLGIYDLLGTANSSPRITGASNFEIRYRGLSTINVDDNIITHFPNPNYKNFPALKNIRASKNAIQAIGDFNTFSNNHYSTEYQTDDELQSSSITKTNQNYYDYLKSLWEEDETKNLEPVKAIKKWLTETLKNINYGGSSVSSVTKSGQRTINNYDSFLDAISADPFYFRGKNGEKYINENSSSSTTNNNGLNPTEGSTNIPYDTNSNITTTSDGALINTNSATSFNLNKGINFGGVRLDISKDIYRIDFSNNQIERIPLSKNMFTNVDFGNNRLRYITPIAAKPLPWFHGLIFFISNLNQNFYNTVNPSNWSKYYNQDNENRPTDWNAQEQRILDALKMGNYSFTLPSFSFYGNQLLDFWPQQDTDSSWYTWPKLTIPTSKRVKGDGANVNSNVNGYPVGPWNHQIGNKSTEFYPWFHRVWIGPEDGGIFSTYLGVFDGNFIHDIATDTGARRGTNNLYGIFFNQLNDNKILTYSQSYNKTINYNITVAKSKSDQAFILPGFNSNAELKQIGTTASTTLSTSSSDVSGTNSDLARKMFDDAILKETSDAYKSYNSQIPYIITRTLPQNHSVLNSWGKQNGRTGSSQMIQVSLVDQDGENVAPNHFSNIDWVHLYANANGLDASTLNFQDLPEAGYNPTDNTTSSSSGSGSQSNNGYNFLTQVLGQLPYYNGRKNAKPWTSATGNKSVGIPLNKFAQTDSGTAIPKSPSYNLIVSAPTQEWTYRYTINVLTDTTYTLNVNDSGSVKDKDHTLDITKTNFTKRYNFASSITTQDLSNEVESWTTGTSYIQNYIKNDSSSIQIKSVDLINNQIVVGFNVNDPTGNRISIADVTLTNFATQTAFLVNNEKVVENFDETTSAPMQFAPKDRNEAIEWIKKHVGVRWIDIKLSSSDTATTTNPISNSADNSLGQQNIHKLSDLKNPEQYISSVFFNKNDGTLSFTLQINSNVNNGGINLVQNHTITTFKKFSYSIDTTKTQKNLAALDYTEEKLKEFVTLKTFQTINGQEENANSKKWSEATNELNQFLPPETELQLTDINRNPEVGSIDFAVSLFEKNASGVLGALIDVKNASIFGLSSFNSSFGWKQNNDRLSGIAFIAHNDYQDKPVSDFKKALLDAASNPKNFNQLILPLLDLNGTAPSFNGEQELSGSTTLTDDKKNQLVIGFHGGATLSATEIKTNVITKDDANLVGINSLTIKGGYLNGKFYAGSDTGAPINTLPSLLVALKPNTTQYHTISNAYKKPVTGLTSTSSYADGKTLFEDALNNKWKDLLPSEWLAELRRLKNRQSSLLVSQLDYQGYDSLTGFLNHVLNTSTSNTSYQTHVDLNNFSGIEINNSTGEVKIAANTLFVNNVYKNDQKAERNPTPEFYDKPISFFLSNYFFRIDESIKKKLPYADNEDVNRTFANESVLGIVNQLEDLLAKAQKLYASTDSNPLTGPDLLAAQDAINILKFKFIHPVYYTNPDADRFFSERFKTKDVKTADVNQMTKFSMLEFTNLNYNEGSLDVKVKVENYITGFDGQHFTLDNKEQSFKITNTLGTFLLPTWKNYAENNFKLRTDDDQLTALDGQKVSGVVTNATLKNWTVEDYYKALITHNNPVNDEYIVLNSSESLFDLATWQLVDNTGIAMADTSKHHADALKTLKEQLNKFHVSLNVRKQDVHYSVKNEQIYLLNPFLHFNVDNASVEQLQILQNIFDPNKSSEQLIDNFGNYQNIGLSNVIIQGFKRQPIIITPQNYKDSEYEINFNGTLSRINTVSGSDILAWLKRNLNEPAAINTFLQSFLHVQGFSRPTQPLSLVLNPDLAELLAHDTPVEQMTKYLLINDGIGQLTFLPGSIQIVNSYQVTAMDLNPDPVNLDQFLTDPTQARIELTRLKLVNTGVIVVEDEQVSNQLVRDGIQSNIRDATMALQTEHFALAYRYLQLNQVLISKNNGQRLIIHDVYSDIAKGTIVIQYEIENAFVDGQIKNLQQELVITGFNSNSQYFLTTHLPWILVTLSLLAIAVYYGIWRHRHTTNSIKYTLTGRDSSHSRPTKVGPQKLKKSKGFSSTKTK
ncbi:hypothetical protein J2Z62_000572 [Mycoplasmoides fastidiosum]|uniref:ECM-binding protein homolog n=1 Tax=Mycoplasmoides fastidiosum TaxID=92758 RepID=A0ABU0LZJ9_9BACT|nr:hypothetical protein [Mycoplasmoides fastidiosum]MDQ0514134.1 hypothetical protein [Mycoplasmoides fastidiosum]UUD37458.1 hypothetical protein NPA10_02670 [Mycoplasmoides fastidiosum]